MGGNGLSCAAWSQKVDLLQKRANGRNSGPAPDLKDLAYGPQARQKLDVYRPEPVGDKGNAPIILMVHGGGWCVGDKVGAKVVANNVGRWVPKGFIVVSVNYPVVGDGSDALEQAQHIAIASAR